MECFAAPNGASLPDVPYLGSNSYDFGPFLTFPQRVGFDAQVLRLGQPEVVFEEDEFTILYGFLQDWLFFGLLHHMICTTPPIDEIIQPSIASPSGKRLDTSLVDSLFTRVIEDGRSLPETQRKARANDLDQIFDETRKQLRFLATMTETSDYEGTVRTFLGLFYELAAAVGGAAYQETTVYYGEQHGAIEITAGASSTLGRLQENKWCPREIWSLVKKYNSTIGYYASLLINPSSNKDHSMCTSLVCEAFDVCDDKLYPYRHERPFPCCEFLPVDTRKVIATLEQGLIPGLTYDGRSDASTHIEVTAADSSTPYVAISHVWSDGMGNPRANAMPICQLERISSICKSENGSHMPFWIDTLCCPTEPEEATELAIILMRKTYHEAAAVVVLDEWLSSCSAQSVPAPDIMLRIMLSGWSRRLWTFQEGMLGRQVWILFADQLVPMDEVARTVRASLECRYLPLRHYLIQEYIRLQGMAKAHGSDRQILYFVVEALKFRSTSVATDEALCLGGILNLDMAKVLEVPAEQRMERVWDLLSDIPQDVIFLDAPKLSSKGFRWAPATLRMPTGTENLFSQLFWEMDKPAGLRSNDGLKVEFDGFLFRPLDGVPSLGDLIAKNKLAEYKFTDQFGNFYTSELLTNEIKIRLSEYRGLSTDNSSSPSPRGRPFRLTDGGKDLYTLPTDPTASSFAILVRSLDLDLYHSVGGIGLLAYLDGPPTTRIAGVTEDSVSLKVRSVCHTTVKRAKRLPLKERDSNIIDQASSPIATERTEIEEGSSNGPTSSRERSGNDLPLPILCAESLKSQSWFVD